MEFTMAQTQVCRLETLPVKLESFKSYNRNQFYLCGRKNALKNRGFYFLRKEKS